MEQAGVVGSIWEYTHEEVPSPRFSVGRIRLDWNKAGKVSSVRGLTSSFVRDSHQIVSGVWTCNWQLPCTPAGALSSLSRSYRVNPEEGVTECMWSGWDVLERLQVRWYWTWASGNWLGEDFQGSEWQILPAVTAAYAKAQWQGLYEKRWAVIFVSPRDLFIWTNTFYIFVYFLIGREYNSYLCDWPSNQKRSKLWMDYSSNIFRIMFY